MRMLLTAFASYRDGSSGGGGGGGDDGVIFLNLYIKTAFRRMLRWVLLDESEGFL